MKKILFLLISILTIGLSSKAQIDFRSPDYHYWNQMSIGKTDGTATATNAWLEIGKYGTSKYMILPRFNTFNIVGQEGAFGYDINFKKLYYHNGSAWQELLAKNDQYDSLIINAKYFPNLGILRLYNIQGDSINLTITQNLSLSGNTLGISGGNTVNLTTSNVNEGSNLYFTSQRVRNVFTFNNGLNYDQTGGIIKLGGTLSQNTNLNLSGFNLNFSNGSNNIFQISSDGTILLNSYAFRDDINYNNKVLWVDDSGILKTSSINFSSDSSATITLNNISALRENNFFQYPKKKTAYVKGYYSAGDDGGGWFSWDETNTNLDDGGVTINPTANVGIGRWIRMLPNNTVNVRMFGAKGDRSTDDINAIRAAASFVGSRKGGTLLFTNGEYTVSDSIRSESANMRFVGDKNATIVYGGSNRIGIILRHDSCEISGLRFTTESTTTSSILGAIFLQGASYCKIFNNILTNASGHGIALFAGNSFHNNNSSRYQSGCNYNLIEGNTVVKMKGYTNDASDYSAIMVGYSSTIGDTGNIITNNILHGDFNSGHGVALIGSVYNNIVTNNIIKGFRQYGIVVYKTANVADYSCQGNKIINNTIDSIGVLSGSTLKGMGIYLQKAEKTIVTNNHIRRTLLGASGGTLAQSGIGVGNSNDCDISDNRIDSIAAPYAGIRVNNSFNVNVKSNVINDGLNGIYCDKSSKIKIDGNIIISSRSQGIVIRPDTAAYTNSAGFASIPTGDGITITNNNITSSSTGIDYAATSVSIGTNNIITGNNINAVGSGMLISFLKKSKISDNIISGSGAGNAIQIGSSSDSNIVANNYIFKTNGSGGTYTFGISDTGPNDNIYNNKIFNSSTRISFNGSTFFPDPKTMFGSAAPTAGTWSVGDRVYNSSVTSSSNVGWVCTTAGTPGTWTPWGGSSSGVTSVALTAPSVFSVSGTPITSSGTIAINFASGQSANQVLATPNGSTGVISLRSLDAADIVTGNIASARLSNSILNQNITPQTANFYITGTAQIGQSITTTSSGVIGALASDGTLGESLIGSVSNHPTKFITNNTRMMTILTNGNVGIGTETPTAKLHLIGSAKMPLANPGNGKVLTDTSGQGDFAWRAVGGTGETIGIVYSDTTCAAFPTGISNLILRPSGNNTIELSSGATYIGAKGRVVNIYNASNFTYTIHGVTINNKKSVVVWYNDNTPYFSLDSN